MLLTHIQTRKLIRLHNLIEWRDLLSIINSRPGLRHRLHGSISRPTNRADKIFVGRHKKRRLTIFYRIDMSVDSFLWERRHSTRCCCGWRILTNYRTRMDTWRWTNNWVELIVSCCHSCSEIMMFIIGVISVHMCFYISYWNHFSLWACAWARDQLGIFVFKLVIFVFC